MTDNGPIEVAGIVGSLRRQSWNRGLLRTAMLLQPEGMRLYELPIGDLPLYDEDLEQAGDPPPVRAFKAGIARADALLICTPEYNYSVPGVLKNAIDWASRPPRTSVLKGKPAAMMGAAAGRSGTMRSQLHLRQVLVSVNVLAIPDPQIYVTFARDKFNAANELTDQPTLDQVRQLLENLMLWTRRVGAGG